MTQPAKVQEPSMEEILASIRRIIADDEAKPPGAEKPAASNEAGSAKAPPCKPIGRLQPLMPRQRRRQPSRAGNAGQKDVDAALGESDAAPPGKAVHPLPDGEVLELTDEMALPTRLVSTRSSRRMISKSTKPPPPRSGANLLAESLAILR